MAIVYQHIRLDTNEIFYIGISIYLKRAFSKNNRSCYWKKIVNKIGFKVDILFENITWGEACEKEKEFIKLYGRKDLNTGILINMTDGGGGKCNPSQEERLKMKERRMNKPIPTSIRIKISNSLKGHIQSDIVKDKISRKMAKKVIRYDRMGIYIDEFDSLEIASEKTKIHHSNICQTCKGMRKTAGGFIWKYKN